MKIKNVLFLVILSSIMIGTVGVVSAGDFCIAELNDDINMSYDNLNNYHINYGDDDYKYQFNITLTPSEDKSYDKYGGVVTENVKGKSIVKNMKVGKKYKVKKLVKVPVYKKVTKKVKTKDYYTKFYYKGKYVCKVHGLWGTVGAYSALLNVCKEKGLSYNDFSAKTVYKYKYVTKKVVKGYKKVYKCVDVLKFKTVKTTLKPYQAIVRGEGGCIPSSITVSYGTTKVNYDGWYMYNANYDVNLEVWG